MRKQKSTLIAGFILLILAACMAPTISPTSKASSTSQSSPTLQTSSVPDLNSSRLVPVEQVDVQTGVGSPISVNIVASGSWPDRCAQLTEVQQNIENSTIMLTLLATPEEKNCPPDPLGLPFGLSIPINIVQLPIGTYTITVNGVSTSFVWDPATLKPEENVILDPLSFEPTTFRDETAGFEFDYPNTWILNNLGQVGIRGSTIQLTSWPPETDEASNETPNGSSRIDVTLYTWDPKNDLAAYLSTRKQAWEASGMSIQSEETLEIAEDHPAALFKVLTPDQTDTALFLITTAGEKYLVLSGMGNLEMLGEIMHTVRPVGLSLR